ncbi:hypothetical protein [Candidatus Burkholderia verschuerenii]|uniref:hypothetical protein n=1 Tax=Candidatus Burkholderia verschuerenii TaxID=242163 RepID=UPI00067D7F3C|nr:hypothetical protein [Candidatus Burkholderia verschuerenii]
MSGQDSAGADNSSSRRQRQEAELKDFLRGMDAQRYVLTSAEERAARALLAEGFEAVEVAAFLQASPWAAFYRGCLRKHHLPESEAVRDALRKSFELGESMRAAADQAVEAMRKEADEMFGPVAEPSEAHRAPDFEMELFGRARSRDKHWPAWMRELTQAQPPVID